MAKPNPFAAALKRNRGGVVDPDGIPNNGDEYRLVNGKRVPVQSKGQDGGKFIAGAIKRPGALTAKAKAAGQSVDQFAKAHRHDPGLTGQQSRFYLLVLRKAGR